MPNLGPYIPMIAALVALGLIAAVLYRKHWLSTQPEETPPMKSSSFDSLSQNAHDSADYGRWQAEMHELTRELKGELDTKMAALQQLILQARAESERLEGLLARAKQAKTDLPGGEPRG